MVVPLRVGSTMIGGKHPSHAAPGVDLRHAAPVGTARTGSPTPAAPTADSGHAAPGMLGGKHELARYLARCAEVIDAP